MHRVGRMLSVSGPTRRKAEKDVANDRSYLSGSSGYLRSSGAKCWVNQEVAPKILKRNMLTLLP